MTAPAAIFITKNKAFSILCCALFIFSLIPGILWYQSASQGEAFSTQRHLGAQTVNTATIGIDKINQGGILPYSIIDRQFVNLNKLQLDDFYLPVFAFLMFTAGIWIRLNRQFILFFSFGLTIFLIGLANAFGLHAVLYQYIPFFKYFRNLQFFLWIAVLPVFILFVAGQVQVFMRDRPDHPWSIGWITTTHAGAVLFCWIAGTKGFATYLVIIFSLAWMLFIIRREKNTRVGLWLLWAAIILQPFDVLGHWAEHYPPVAASRFAYENIQALRLPSAIEKDILLLSTKPASSALHIDAPSKPYFAIRWYYDALKQIPYPTLQKHMNVPFLVYDSIRYAEQENTDYETISQAMTDFKNTAFIHTDDSLILNGNGSSQARIITADDRDFKILRFNANSLVVQTSFIHDQFLVWNKNYHSRWRAYLDGKETPLYRTNIFARGLLVPAGEHIIQWQFEQTWRYILAYFFIALYAGILGILLWLAYRSKTSV